MHRLAVRRPVFFGLAIVVFMAMASVTTHMQGTADIAVVVRPDVPVDNLSMVDLRRVVLGDREFWPGGVRITLLIRAPIARERDAAVKDISQMTEAQFRQHWIGKVFRAETPSGPKITYSRESALAHQEISHLEIQFFINVQGFVARDGEHQRRSADAMVVFL